MSFTLDSMTLQPPTTREYQFGFQKGSSTTSATLTLIHKCIDSIEAERYTALVFIGIQKAFDCVNHEVLMEKLEMLGVRGPLYTLISDYLFSRKQRIQVGDERCEFRFVGNGVPQGSTLSTLLFLLYVNGVFKLHLKDICSFSQTKLSLCTAV